MEIIFDFLCVDFQYDFANVKGQKFTKGESVEFIINELFPFFVKYDIKVSEILSDYRLPRGKSENELCVPGDIGFISLLPDNLRRGKPWIKCMHNPLWVRENIGVPNAKLGPIYQNPEAFNQWIKEHLQTKNVILFGETAECCLLQVASELYFRGFNVYYIYEATDPMAERLLDKDKILFNSTVSIYVKTVKYSEFIEMIGVEKW